MLGTVIVILSEVKLLLETCHTSQAIKETRVRRWILES